MQMRARDLRLHGLRVTHGRLCYTLFGKFMRFLRPPNCTKKSLVQSALVLISLFWQLNSNVSVFENWTALKVKPIYVVLDKGYQFTFNAIFSILGGVRDELKESSDVVIHKFRLMDNRRSTKSTSFSPPPSNSVRTFHQVTNVGRALYNFKVH